MGELCVRHAMSTPGISAILTGVETVAQMKENAAFMAKSPLPESVMREIKESVPEFGLNILNPINWPKK